MGFGGGLGISILLLESKPNLRTFELNDLIY